MFNERRSSYKKSGASSSQKFPTPPSGPRHSKDWNTKLEKERDSPYSSRNRHPLSDNRKDAYISRRERNDVYENDRHRLKRGRYNNSNFGNSKNDYKNNQNLEAIKIYPLESLRIKDTRWDLNNPMLKGMSARFAKSMGVFSSPSDNKLADLKESEIDELLRKQENFEKIRKKRVDQYKLPGPNDSKLSKKVIFEGIDFKKITPQTVHKYLENLLASTVIPNVSYEDLALTTTVKDDENVLEVECVSSLVATTLVSFHMKYIDEFQCKLTVNRPHEYISYSNLDDENDETCDSIKEEIVECSNLVVVNNLPLEVSITTIKEKLSKYGKLHSLVTLIDKLTYESNGVAFFSFKNSLDSEKNLKNILSEILSNEGWNCYLACENAKNDYKQKINVTLENIRELIDFKTNDISRHQITSTIQLHNAISMTDLLDSIKYNKTYEAFKTELSQLQGFENMVLIKPPEGFRLQVDEVQPEYGRIYVKFKSAKNAKTCLQKICGRKFHDRLIFGGYLDDADYKRFFPKIDDIKAKSNIETVNS
jgi:hypothetical protein